MGAQEPGLALERAGGFLRELWLRRRRRCGFIRVETETDS